MPRGPSRRGGTRTGTPGRAYPNRTDLSAGQNQRSVPIRVATGQEYGRAQQQLQAQRTVPLAPPPTPIPPPSAPLPSPAPATPFSPQQPPAAAQSLSTASLSGLLSQIGPQLDQNLYRPSERPNEPVTAGAALGPGPGPEIMPQANPNASMAAMLSSAAQLTNDPSLRALASQAAQSGQ